MRERSYFLRNRSLNDLGQMPVSDVYSRSRRLSVLTSSVDVTLCPNSRIRLMKSYCYRVNKQNAKRALDIFFIIYNNKAGTDYDETDYNINFHPNKF